eukprot:TRINITY_DN13895_c0_g1_i1.p1 TRINITY_DN13895_c0_g1~~TRINITY_DN13895_c0_g1_i1.p1  ORF type:complete len:516 (+),score=63.36 TRINITY_DN13895_c0_g1_i1:91-1548(+)
MEPAAPEAPSPPAPPQADAALAVLLGLQRPVTPAMLNLLVEASEGSVPVSPDALGTVLDVLAEIHQQPEVASPEGAASPASGASGGPSEALGTVLAVMQGLLDAAKQRPDTPVALPALCGSEYEALQTVVETLEEMRGPRPETPALLPMLAELHAERLATAEQAAEPGHAPSPAPPAAASPGKSHALRRLREARHHAYVTALAAGDAGAVLSCLDRGCDAQATLAEQLARCTSRPRPRTQWAAAATAPQSRDCWCAVEQNCQAGTPPGAPPCTSRLARAGSGASSRRCWSWGRTRPRATRSGTRPCTGRSRPPAWARWTSCSASSPPPRLWCAPSRAFWTPRTPAVRWAATSTLKPCSTLPASTAPRQCGWRCTYYASRGGRSTPCGSSPQPGRGPHPCTSPQRGATRPRWPSCSATPGGDIHRRRIALGAPLFTWPLAAATSVAQSPVSTCCVNTGTVWTPPRGAGGGRCTTPPPRGASTRAAR